MKGHQKDENPFHIQKKTALRCNSSMERTSISIFSLLHFQMFVIYHSISEY